VVLQQKTMLGAIRDIYAVASVMFLA